MGCCDVLRRETSASSRLGNSQVTNQSKKLFFKIIQPNFNSFGENSPNMLMKTTLSGFSNANCIKALPTYNVTSTQLCTFTKGTDSCQRDSGGSLYFTSTGRKFTVATVSYGVYCASSQPSVNTRITSFRTWITANTNGSFFCNKIWFLTLLIIHLTAFALERRNKNFECIITLFHSTNCVPPAILW